LYVCVDYGQTPQLNERIISYISIDFWDRLLIVPF
jgi:hypothetical protein